MKKPSLLLLAFLLLAFEVYAQKSGKRFNYVQQLGEKDTLRLSYFGGDDGYITCNILIIKRGKAVFAERHGEPLFVGTRLQPVWVKKLNRKHLQMINQYVEGLKVSQGCVGGSSVYEDISVSILKDTLAQYKGFCWLNFIIESQLFKKEFKQLSIARKRYADTLNHLIWGIYYPGVQVADSTGKYLFLSRRYQPETSYAFDCTWQFSSPKQFKSRCKNFDLDRSTHYSWVLENGKVELQIGPGVVRDSLGNATISNSGLEYELVKITPQGILLKNAFDYWESPD